MNPANTLRAEHDLKTEVWKQEILEVIRKQFQPTSVSNSPGKLKT